MRSSVNWILTLISWRNKLRWRLTKVIWGRSWDIFSTCDLSFYLQSRFEFRKMCFSHSSWRIAVDFFGGWTVAIVIWLAWQPILHFNRRWMLIVEWSWTRAFARVATIKQRDVIGSDCSPFRLWALDWHSIVLSDICWFHSSLTLWGQNNAKQQLQKAVLFETCFKNASSLNEFFYFYSLISYLWKKATHLLVWFLHCVLNFSALENSCFVINTTCWACELCVFHVTSQIHPSHASLDPKHANNFLYFIHFCVTKKLSIFSGCGDFFLMSFRCPV